MASPKRSHDDALSYLRLVRETVKEDQYKYREFLQILKKFQANSINIANLVSTVKSLFEPHPQLLLGLNDFLPKGLRFETLRPGVVVISTGLGRLPPSDQPTRLENVAETSRDKHSKDMQRALNFVNKVSRFCEEKHVYTGFLGILKLYNKGLEIEEVTRRISSLFVGHGDLVEEFASFLPPCKKCGSLPACALKKIMQAHPGRNVKANGMPGKRVTNPCIEGVGDVGDGVQDHSSPKGKKQCREDENGVKVDVGPLHLSPSKRQRKNDDEGKKYVAVQTDHQGLATEEDYQTRLQDSSHMPNKQGQTTGMVVEENNRPDGKESEEHLKRVGEPACTSVSHELPKEHSPLKVRLQRKKSSIPDDEKNPTHLGKGKAPLNGVGEETNIGPFQKMPQEYSLRNIKKLHKRNEKLREENGTAQQNASEDSPQEGVMLADICSSQTLPQELPCPTIRKRQKKTVEVEEEKKTAEVEAETRTAEVEEEKNTTHQREHNVKEGIEETGVCPYEKLSQEPQSPKISKQSNKVEEGSAETLQSESSESAKEEGGQMDLCVPPNQPRVNEQQKKTDQTEEDDVVAEHSNAKGISPWEEETNPWDIYGLENKEEESKEENLQGESSESAEEEGGQWEVRQEEEPCHWFNIESEDDGADHSNSEGMSPWEEANKEEETSPWDIYGLENKEEENKEENLQSESSESAEEEGGQMDLCVSPNQPRVNEQQKKTDQPTEDDVVAEHSNAKGVSPWEQANKEEESNPWNIYSLENKKEEHKEENLQSESSESAEEEGGQMDLCVSPNQPRVNEQQKKTDQTQEDNVVAEHSNARGMSPWAEKNKKEETSKWDKYVWENNELENKEEENKVRTDDSESDESGKKAGEEAVVHVPEQLPLKRMSARVARELIWKQCQATEARQAAKAANIEEEQRRKRLQQLEEERNAMLQQKQHEIFEKLEENLRRHDGSKCFQNFCREILSCPELQTAVSEVLEEQELEYSDCKRCTTSYYQLPKSYLKPLTTHRSKLDRAVLNDNLVSVGYDDDCDENSNDESIGARKQIRREGSGKRVPHDQRLFHEEQLFHCEDDQYELDILRHTTASTRKKVEEMVDVMQAPGFCKEEAFDWNEYLTPVHFRCIERIYGDYGVEFIEQSQKNPIVALPIILGHLKQKEEDEWPAYQLEMEKFWAGAHAEHFLKSLDYSETDDQDNDTVQVDMDRFPPEPSLNEDQWEDGSVRIADGESASMFSFKHHDLELMYKIMKHLLKEFQLTEQQFEKVQSVWSVHVNSTEGVPDINSKKRCRRLKT